MSIPHLDYNNVFAGWNKFDESFKARNKIADFRGFTSKDIYQRLFDFCNGTLLNNHEYLKSPGIFFFTTRIDMVNARAGKENGIYYILFYMQTVEFFNSNFRSNRSILIDGKLNDYEELNAVSDWPMNELMYQIVLQYIFYHEFAHLIQIKSADTDFMIDEKMTTSNNSIKSHIKEIDADIFAAYKVAHHVKMYIDKWTSVARVYQIEKVISAVTSGILIYFYIVCKQVPKYYRDEYTHPHPGIRALVAIKHLTSAMQKLYRNQYTGISKQSVIQQTFEITNVISNNIFEYSPLNFATLIGTHIHDMDDYYKEIMGKINESQNMAVHQMRHIK